MEQFDQYIGFLLVQIMRLHRNQVGTELNKLGLHAGQEMILCQLVEEDGVTQTHLASCLEVEMPTVNKMVQRMESAKLVERRPDANDARVSRVYLTEQGRSLQDGIGQVWEALERKTLQGLSEVEVALLRRLLLQIHDNLHENAKIP